MIGFSYIVCKNGGQQINSRIIINPEFIPGTFNTRAQTLVKNALCFYLMANTRRQGMAFFYL
ncbi:hypothetical protein QFZ37_003201 [Chryseobacterium ginsenosidimutans]|nr:hypothetical protein [Chryseobacterium ginsenosidimutans]